MASEFETFLDGRLAPAADQLSRRAKRVASLAARLQKAAGPGDLRAVEAALRDLQGLPLEEPLADVSGTVGGYDYRAYLNGPFAEEFQEACRAAGLPLEGHFPVYTVFPFPVRVDVDSGTVVINRTRVSSLRPSALVAAITAERERLERSPFNLAEFLAALFSAWEKMNAVQSVKNDIRVLQPQPLRQVYRELVPFGRWRRDYPESFFAYDIQRVLLSPDRHHNGWQCALDRGRGSSALRLIDRDGQERLIASVHFVEVAA